MRSHYLKMGFLFIGILIIAGVAQAGQGSHNRQITLPYVCQGGPNNNNICIPDSAECPSGECGIDFICHGGAKDGQACTADPIECPRRGQCVLDGLIGPGSAFQALLTIMVDDHVSKWDGTEEVPDVHAVTILFQTRYQGQDHFIAQTYQNLENSTDLDALKAALQIGPILADTNKSRGPVDEEKLNDSVDEGFIGDDHTRSLLDDLLWQKGDNEIAEELRNIFRTTGQPILEEAVIVKTPDTLAGVQHSDYELNGLASTVRLQVRFRFVPVGPQARPRR